MSPNRSPWNPFRIRSTQATSLILARIGNPFGPYPLTEVGEPRPGRTALGATGGVPVRRSVHPEPARHVDGLAGHIRRFVGGQERDHAGDVLGQSDAAHRDLRLALLGG